MIELQPNDFIVRNDTAYDIDGRIVGYVTGTSREANCYTIYYNGDSIRMPASAKASMKIDLYFDSFLNHKQVAPKEKIDDIQAEKPKSRAIKI